MVLYRSRMLIQNYYKGSREIMYKWTDRTWYLGIYHDLPAFLILLGVIAFLLLVFIIQVHQVLHTTLLGPNLQCLPLIQLICQETRLITLKWEGQHINIICCYPGFWRTIFRGMTKTMLFKDLVKAGKIWQMSELKAYACLHNTGTIKCITVVNAAEKWINN